MKKKIILTLALLCLVGSQGFAQDTASRVTGYILDSKGRPVSGALVTSNNDTSLKEVTDIDGKFTIQAQNKDKLTISTPDSKFKTVLANVDNPMTIVMEYYNQIAHIGYEVAQNIEESTSSIHRVSAEELNKRGSKDIANSLFGHGLGLTALQNSGNYADYSPTLYVRGLQTMTTSSKDEDFISKNSALILVDGIERDISEVVPEEVESINILKDAAAVAIYGYKGANGVINIMTKRGKYGSKEMKFSYEHGINWEIRRPDFANSLTYANAVNEALGYDGRNPRYKSEELELFGSGEYPYLFPNVDWIKETFKNSGKTNNFNLNFRGGGKTFRYYSMLNLHNNQGFVSYPNSNTGYSTQDKYSKANIRTNLDIDLTKTTKLELNILGTMSESNAPGMGMKSGANSTDKADIWNMIYSLPSAAFAVKTQDEGMWGGTSVWPGTLNPVAQTHGSGHSKGHNRTLYADMTLKQDLSLITKGLGASVRLAYDNKSMLWEDRSKTYIYGNEYVSHWYDGKPDETQLYSSGKDSEMATASDIYGWNRAYNVATTLYYNRVFDKHKIYAQAKWDYEFRNRNGVNNTTHRHNISLYTHYGYRDRYYADLTLVASASNNLAPGTKWSYSPTVSLAWVISKENFLKSVDFINFLKLRTSFGILNVDFAPANGYWTQTYVSGTGSSYPLGQNYESIGGWRMDRLYTQSLNRERANKFNFGLDATLFGGLNLTLDGYYQNRTKICVDSDGKYSEVLGIDAPYEFQGEVRNWGVEAGIDYVKQIGEVLLNVGASYAFTRNKIIEQLEEPRAYRNLIRTNNPLQQIYGLEAMGLFKDQADIDASPTQYFSDVIPGDIKYRDVNKDGIVDKNDVTKIGYNTFCPEIYYSFKLGAQWKGIGFSAMFQGAGNYSAYLDTKSMFRPLTSNNTISNHYYENRWTPQNLDAKYPRLSSAGSENNTQRSSFWIEDRSFLKLRYVELFYNFPKSLLGKTKVIKDTKIYLRGVDLLCFDKIKVADPESYGVVNPLNRSLVIGLTLGF